MSTLRFRSMIKSTLFILLVSIFSCNAFAAPTKKSLVIYFTQPENVNLDGADGQG